ncbi:MAG: hypothetical protein V1779_05855 [bacterium]
MNKDYYDKYKEHILHEVKMLMETSKFLIENKLYDKVLSYPCDIVYLDSFLLHFRNLYDFLNYNTRFPTDIDIKEIIDNWDDIKNSQLRENFDNIKYHLMYKSKDDKIQNRLNKYLAHLTIEREDKTISKNWNIISLLQEIKSICLKFSELVDDNELKSLLNSNSNSIVINKPGLTNYLATTYIR